MIRRSILLPILLVFNTLYLSAQNNSLYFPPKTGNTWATTPPGTLGFCPERIDSLYNFLAANDTKSFILLQDGKIVLEKYFGAFVQDSIWYWASAGKSLTAFLVGQAQEEGLLDIDDATSDYLGTGWTVCTPAQEAAITIRQQLTMTTGLDDTPTTTSSDPNECTDPDCLQYLAPPGTRWAYHTGAYRLLQDVIASASGQTINQFTKTHVLDRTGMKGLWVADVMYGRARDMARYGLLILANGVWDSDTLLHDQAYFTAMTHTSQGFNQSYGYLWWLNGQSSFMLPGSQIVFPGSICPNAPADMFAALGKNDQKIHVVPSKGWVVVRQGNPASITGPLGGQVPIGFDNALWGYLNELVCTPSATSDFIENEAVVKISPNPAASGIWQIETSFLPIKMDVRNAQGNLLQTVFPEKNTSTRIDGSGWPAGFYWLNMVDAEGKSRVEKLVKTD